MTDQLGPSGRALLDAARPALGPDPDAARRMRAKIAATVGGSAAIAAGGRALGVKLGLVGLAAAIAIGAIAYTKRDAPVTPAKPAIVAIAPVAPPPATAPIVIAEPVEQEMPAVDVTRPKVKPSAPAITLAREVELVDHAMASLKQHDPRAALASIRIYDIEAANHGQLAEDAAAIEAEALCTLADPSAAAQLAAFDRRFPSSAQRARLTAACEVAR